MYRNISLYPILRVRARPHSNNFRVASSTAKSTIAVLSPEETGSNMPGLAPADKTSSVELSEAINSMYKWYQAATICYAYFEDIRSSQSCTDCEIGSCRCLTRGWTLQELVAPSIIEFYAYNWTKIGTKMSLQGIIAKLTGIPTAFLSGTIQANDYTVAERILWASDRQTTRKEDEAYSPLGIFNIYMPMLYGEGTNAFQRLQEEF